MFTNAPLPDNQRDEEIHLNKKCKWKRRRKPDGYRWKRKCKCAKKYPEEKHIHSRHECSYIMVQKWSPGEQRLVYVLEINCHCSHCSAIRRYVLWKRQYSLNTIFIVHFCRFFNEKLIRKKIIFIIKSLAQPAFFQIKHNNIL